MKAGNVLLGVVAGIAIGATLGVLFAQAKGSVTRNQITKKGDELADDVKDRVNNIVDNFLSRIETTLRNVKAESEKAESEIKVE